MPGITFWLPMGFVIAGVLLYLWEVSMPGFFVAVPATVLILLGTLGLMFEWFLFSIWAPITGVVIAVPTIFGTLVVYRKMAPPASQPSTTIGSSLVGRTGVVTTDVHPEVTTGKVRIEGQIWSATADRHIPAGTRVVVESSRGVHVTVRPAEAPPLGASS